MCKFFRRYKHSGVENLVETVGKRVRFPHTFSTFMFRDVFKEEIICGREWSAGMQEIEKTTVKRQQSMKRQHRRTRHNGAYILLVIGLIAGIAFTLSFTRLFNVTDVVIEDDTGTPSERLIECCGFSRGDNMMRMDTRKMARQIEDQIVYAENVYVHRDLPSTLVIHVEKAVPVANIMTDAGCLLISESGRILEILDEPREGLIVLTGYQAEQTDLGAWLKAKDTRQDTVLKTMMNAAETVGDSRIETVDMTDPGAIIVHLGENIEFRMGSSSDAVYKLRLALGSIQQINPGKKYLLRMVGNNQISVVPLDTEIAPGRPAQEEAAGQAEEPANQDELNNQIPAQQP